MCRMSSVESVCTCYIYIELDRDTALNHSDSRVGTQSGTGNKSATLYVVSDTCRCLPAHYIYICIHNMEMLRHLQVEVTSSFGNRRPSLWD